MAIFFKTKMEGQQGGWLKTGNSPVVVLKEEALDK